MSINVRDKCFLKSINKKHLRFKLYLILENLRKNTKKKKKFQINKLFNLF